MPLPSTCNPSLLGYIPTSLKTYDIARQGDDNSPNDIWVATDHADSPIRAYNTAGTLTFACDLVNPVRGMAFNSAAGHDYIWVSNPSDGRIYQIDLNPTGIGEAEGATIEVLDVSPSSNPFRESVIFSVTGAVGQATIEIYDMSGRALARATVSGTFAWDGLTEGGATAPSGVYFARVRDSSGQEAYLALTRL
ncbi:T9SS type A sorting domain-containing protein [Candidatus Fermentibacterales bacterium]|nr:T9SS type A sorting domain-containing protein [Candidatus Fermentibacterales bacterium]